MTNDSTTRIDKIHKLRDEIKNTKRTLKDALSAKPVYPQTWQTDSICYHHEEAAKLKDKVDCLVDKYAELVYELRLIQDDIQCQIMAEPEKREQKEKFEQEAINAILQKGIYQQHSLQLQAYKEKILKP